MVTLTKSVSGGSMSITGLAEGQERVVTSSGGFSIDANEVFTLTTSEVEGGLAKSYRVGDYTNVVGFASRSELFDYLFEFFGSVGVSAVNLKDENGNIVGVQSPLPTDGDSVYTKDIRLDSSIVTNWVDLDGTGEEIAYILFNDLHTAIENNTSDNPKIIRFHFNRTVNAHQIGLGCAEHTGKNFSNVAVKLLGSGGAQREAVDESANNTKYTSRNYQFSPQLFNAVELEFHTSDTITLTNNTIQKSTITASTLQALKPDGTITDIDATAGGNLKVSIEEFEAEAFENNPLPTKPQQNLDAFERLRTSSTDQRLDVEFKYNLQPDIFLPIVVGSGSISHNTLTRDVSINVNSTTNGDKAEFIQLWDNPYTDGNSQLVAITGTPDLSNINILSAEVYVRDAIRGGEEIITQNNWLALKDGRNWQYSHIFLIDFQSLKVGTVRFFIDTDGMAVKVAQINNDNRRAHGYWQDPNQPLVWRIYNTATETITEIGYDDGTNGVGFRFRQPLNVLAEAIAICGTVKSEGGGNLLDIEGFPVAVDRNTISKIVGTTPVPVLSVRSKLTFKGLPNKSIAIPRLVSLQTDNDIHYYLVYSGILVGAVWIDVDTNDSALEYDASATAIIGGKKEDSDYLSTGSRNQTSGKSGFLGKTVLTAARGTQDSFTLVAVRTGTVNANVLASFGLTEII